MLRKDKELENRPLAAASVETELDSVVGGVHMKDGKTYSDNPGENGHWMVTTALNKCAMYTSPVFNDTSSTLDHCFNCVLSSKEGSVLYCRARTEENGL